MLEHLDMKNTTDSHSEVDSEEDEEVSRILGKPVKKNSKNKMLVENTTLMEHLVDIILENDTFKEKLFLTNVKNSKNSQYYQQVMDELKDRCKQRDRIFTYDPNQTRQKIKRCVSICGEAALKIKTASGIHIL